VARDETQTAPRRAFLGIGSNLGDRLSYLQLAVDALSRTPGVRVTAVSRVYETAPVGGPAQGSFLNAVVAIETELDEQELLGRSQAVEQLASRVRVERWGPRTLDVDILLVDGAQVDRPDLTIPHPRMWERGFVLAPLRDVAPDLVDADLAWEGVRETGVTLSIPPLP
jgi:2-amino-4-hydroxy-6-hydroxymethyldihydropteridine diphosphokinase